MSSGTVHDPIADHLITSERRAGGDRSPVFAFEGVRSMDRDRLLENMRGGVLT